LVIKGDPVAEAHLVYSSSGLAEVNRTLKSFSSSLKNAEKRLSGIGKTGKAATEKAARGMRTLEKNTGKANRTLERIQRTFIAFAAVTIGRELLSAMGRAIGVGIKYNSLMEDSRIGIATLIASTHEFVDAQGRIAKGSEKMSVAMKYAADTQRFLQFQNLRTAATYDQLLRAYQEGLVPGIGAGFDIMKHEVAKFATAVVQAASAMRIPLDMLGEEVRNIILGQMNARTTRLAPLVMAGLGTSTMKEANEKLRELNKQGKTYETMMKIFKNVSEGAKLSLEALSTKFSNLVDAFKMVMGAGFAKFFEHLKVVMDDVYKSIVDVDEKTGQITLKEEAVKKLKIVGNILSWLTDVAFAFGEAFTSPIEYLKNRGKDLIAFFTGSTRKEVDSALDALERFGNKVTNIIDRAGGWISEQYSKTMGSIRSFVRGEEQFPIKFEKIVEATKKVTEETENWIARAVQQKSILEVLTDKKEDYYKVLEKIDKLMEKSGKDIEKINRDIALSGLDRYQKERKEAEFWLEDQKKAIQIMKERASVAKKMIEDMKKFAGTRKLQSLKSPEDKDTPLNLSLRALGGLTKEELATIRNLQEKIRELEKAALERSLAVQKLYKKKLEGIRKEELEKEKEKREEILKDELSFIEELKKSADDFWTEKEEQLEKFNEKYRKFKGEETQMAIEALNKEARELGKFFGNKVELQRQANEMIAQLRKEEQEKKREDRLKELEESTEFMDGLQRAWIKYKDMVKDNAKFAEDLFTAATKNMEDALISFLETGKASFKDFAQALIADINRIIMRMMAMTIVKKSFDWMGAALGALQIGVGAAAGGGGETSGGGGTTGGGTTGSTNTGMPVETAKGAAFHHNKILALARGGIIDSPTLLAGGAAIGGEAGPEAVMPLKRTSSGDLGVVAEGAGGRVVNVNFTVHAIDAQSFRSALAQQRRTIVGMVDEAITRGGKESNIRY